MHETQRNQQLIADLTSGLEAFPKLYPQDKDIKISKELKSKPYVCISPASVWFTKQFPKEKWISLIDNIPPQYNIYLLGGPSDTGLAQEIKSASKHAGLKDLSGKLSFLQSAALMRDAVMNYANDSAPLHFASAMHAPVTAVFCSTVPAFGFGPVRDNGKIIEIKDKFYKF